MAASPISQQQRTAQQRTAQQPTAQQPTAQWRRATGSPTHVGQWVLLRQIASGPLATVHEARHADAADNAPANYIVKLAGNPNFDDPRAAVVLAREAEVGSAVSHPHLIPVLAAQTERPPYYVVEPRLVGATAAELIRATARPPLTVSLWIVRQTAEALDALYAAGWIHADVKPANIFVSPHGHATLLDLGFARRLDEGDTLVDRRVCGTPSYIAPELFTSRGRADVRSDVYSLGVTLYELISGRRPLAGNNLAEMAHAHLTDRPEDLRAACPDVPEEVCQLVAAMLAKDPLRRPHTPAELIERLVELEITTFANRGA